MVSLGHGARRWGAYVAAGLVAACLASTALALPGNPGPQNSQSHSGDAAPHYPESGAAPLVTIINSPSPQLENSANSSPSGHDDTHKPFWLQWEFWTAIGTLVLGAVTLALVSKTDGLIRASEKSSERQLRAYVSPASMELVEQDAVGTKFEVRVTFKNFGQTPAYDVGFFGRLEIIAGNVISNFDFNIAKPNPFFGAVIGPTQEKFYSCMLDRILTDQQIDDVINPLGGNKFIVWGTVWYRDAFGQSRHTDVCRLVIWTARGVKPIWRDMPQHNDAD